MLDDMDTYGNYRHEYECECRCNCGCNNRRVDPSTYTQVVVSQEEIDRIEKSAKRERYTDFIMCVTCLILLFSFLLFFRF